MRKFVTYKIPSIASFKKKLLYYASNPDVLRAHCCVLDSNLYPGSEYELLAAIGAIDEIMPQADCFDALAKFQQEKNDWLFGFLSYDLKNEIEALCSENFDGLKFPLLHFFQPKYIFRVNSKEEWIVEIGFLTEVSTEEEVNNIFQKIISSNDSYVFDTPLVEISARVSKQEYLRAVNKIKSYIQRGDIYEMNYCMEFFAEGVEINPAEVFLKLNEASQTPFSAFYRLNDNYLLCASPERFLKKNGRKIISQPIKGTARRGKTLFEDITHREQLLQSEKEKSENAMIVDLVRNDLSRTCKNVRVEELFGIYTFKQWHQMISTVSGDMRDGIHFTDVLKNAFPMGSMTGAPKIQAMELIEQYEKTRRGLYSGAVGYITPPAPLSIFPLVKGGRGIAGSPLVKGNRGDCWSPPYQRGIKWDCRRGSVGEVDFDFNVVIRSILYNSSSKYLSFQVGSAITANSIPEEEYQECLLKAKGMFEALNQDSYFPISILYA